MKKLTLALLFIFVSHAQAKNDLPTKVVGLKTPESVVQAKDGSIYVSEINEFGKDGDGQITKIDKNGKISIFATGLDDPKGMVIMNHQLFVTDKTKVLAIDMDGTVHVYVDAKAFPKTPQFLNDIEADGSNNLYVSDSGDLKSGGAIYKIDPNKTVSTVVDSTNPAVLAPNGLCYEGRNSLLEVDFESGILYRINLMTGTMAEVASGFGGGDGLVRTKTGKMYISDWKNGIINQVSAGRAKLVNSGLTSSADMTLSQNGQYLLVPLMKLGELEFISIESAIK
ncbi:MAG: gluconolaconase [Methylophilus sp.]|nr:gluconolaconase [Methylophilus sp.]